MCCFSPFSGLAMCELALSLHHDPSLFLGGISLTSLMKFSLFPWPQLGWKLLQTYLFISTSTGSPHQPQDFLQYNEIHVYSQVRSLLINMHIVSRFCKSLINLVLYTCFFWNHSPSKLVSLQKLTNFKDCHIQSSAQETFLGEETMLYEHMWGKFKSRKIQDNTM